MRSSVSISLLMAGLLAVVEGGATAALAAEYPELHALNHVDELAAVFNENRGRPRLVLLLSPT